MTIQKARELSKTTNYGRVGSGTNTSGVDTILSKMITDRRGYSGYQNNNSGVFSADMLLESNAERQSVNIEDYESILITQPELELPVQILVSCILAPKKSNEIILRHSTRKSDLPTDLAASLTASAKEACENVYKIKDNLAEKIRKALFTHGSFTTLIMSEAAMDDVINGRANTRLATESYADKGKRLAERLKKSDIPLGYFGDSSRSDVGSMGLESMLASVTRVSSSNPIKLETGFERLSGWKDPIMIDNLDYVRVAMATESMLETKRNELADLVSGGSVQGIEKLYHDIQNGTANSVILPTAEEASRRSATRPIERVIPSECVTVVFEPGNPKNHKGYLCLIDEDGSFASRRSMRNRWSTSTPLSDSNRGVISNILNQHAAALKTDGLSDAMLLQTANAIFRKVAKDDFHRRLSRGLVGSNTVAEKETFFNMMFESAMAGRQTRVLFVPSEAMSYWAYRYNDDGSGRSLFEDIHFLAGIRSMLTVSNTEAQIRNSVDHIKLGIVLDENDPHKVRTKEAILDGFIRNRLRSTPWNTTSPRRIVEHLQMAGVSVDVEGGDNYPGTKINISRDDLVQKEIDLELDESIFKRIIMGFGLSPEIVDLSTQIEFSSKMAISNELSRKRVILTQQVTNKHITRDAVRLMLADPVQHEEFERIVKEWIVAQKMSPEDAAKIDVSNVIRLFLAHYEIALPAPEEDNSEEMESFNNFMETLDKILDVVYDEEALAELDSGEFNEAFGRIKAIIRRKRAIDWMVKHDFMTDVLNDLVSSQEEGLSDLVTATVSQYKGISSLVLALMPRLKAANVIDADQYETIMNNLEEQRQVVEGADGESTSSSEEETGGAATGGDGEDPFGDDLFGEEGEGDGVEGDGEGTEEETAPAPEEAEAAPEEDKDA